MPEEEKEGDRGMKGERLELTGKVFGRLLVICYDGTTHQRRTKWLCACSCGDEISTTGGRLVSGQTQSCGCLRKERLTTHGRAGHSDPLFYLYNAYRHAKDRCENPEHHGYKHYGGRGIKVLMTMEEFIEELGPRPDKTYTVDRIDVNGNYEKGNIRWADRHTQAINRRPRRSKYSVVALDDATTIKDSAVAEDAAMLTGPTEPASIFEVVKLNQGAENDGDWTTYSTGMESFPMLRLLYDRKSAAAVLSLSVRTIDYLIKSGKLATSKIGGRVLIHRDELVKFASASHVDRIRPEQVQR